MATKLFLRESDHYQSTGSEPIHDMLITAGSSLTTGVVNTTASGTEIQWTKTAGGAVLTFLSPPLAAGFTLATTDTMTFNLWAFESNASANCGVRVRVYKVQRDGLTGGQEVNGSPFNKGTELGTSAAVQNWTGTVGANMTFVENDRIMIRVYITNIGTMGGSFTCTLDYDGGSGGADGDSWFQLNNNVTFKTEDPIAVCPQWLRPQMASSVVRGHPLAPDFAWFFHEGGKFVNGIIPDRCGRRPGKVFNPAPSISAAYQWTPTGVRFRSQQQGINLGPANLILPANASKITVVIAQKNNSGNYGPASGRNWVGSKGDGSVNQFCLFARDFGPNLTWRLSTSELQAVPSTFAGDNVWVATTGPRGMELWQNGFKFTSNASNPTWTADATNITVGYSPDVGTTDDVTVGWLYIYLRQLTPAEIVQVSRAPC